MLFNKETRVLVPVVLIGLLTYLASAAPRDKDLIGRNRRQDESVGRDVDIKNAYRAEMVQELEELERMEAVILFQLQNLSAHKERLQARKRGIHTQCFLNLVSCYRRR